MNKNEIIQKLEYEIYQSFQLDELEGYYYNIVEPVFYKQNLSNIIINWTDINNAELKKRDFNYKFRKQGSLIKLLEAFDKININWIFDKSTTTDKFISIITEGGVYILIDFDKSVFSANKIII